jgi:hypothetical protein
MRVDAVSIGALLKDESVSWRNTETGEPWVRLAGYGSLLCVGSARRTCPRLRSHRLAWVRGYRRVFSLVSLTCVRRGAPYADWRSKEVAACAAFPSDSGEVLLVAVFDVPRAELQAYLERESQYEFSLVECTEKDSGKSVKAIMCVAPFDCWSGQRITQPLRKTLGLKDRSCYSGPLWRRDIFPSLPYLSLCLRAAARLGALEAFLDYSYLADGHTSLREYMQHKTPMSVETGSFFDCITWNARKSNDAPLLFAAGKWH